MSKKVEINKTIGIKRSDDVLTLSKMSKAYTNKDNAKYFWKEKIEKFIPEEQREALKKDFYEVIEGI